MICDTLMRDMLNNKKLKDVLNKLQYCIDKDSDKKLLIFDNIRDLARYKCIEVKIEDIDKVIPIYIGELINGNRLVGIRFKSYMFV